MYEAAGVGGKGPMMIGVLWFLSLLSLVIISLRIYTRKFIRGKVGWDDYCLVVTWVLILLFVIVTTVACVHGMGRHFDELETSQFARAMLLVLCGQVIASLFIGMGKVAVAVFLLRIVTASWQHWFLWFCIGSMMVLSTLLSIAVFAQCTPVESIWNPLLVKERVCSLNLTVLAFVVCSYAAALDFLLAIFPWIALRGLNMKRKERITICVSLSLGVVAGVCGVIRTSGLNALSNSTDYLFAISDSIVWTTGEATTTIICVCIPALRPLYGRLRGLESSTAGYQKNDGSGYEASSSYKLSSYPGRNKDDGLSYNRSAMNTNVEAGHSRNANENHSDESVLLQGESNIMRVQEVTVTYEESRAKNEQMREDV